MDVFANAFLLLTFLGFILFSKELVLPRRFFEREEGRRIRDYIKRKASVVNAIPKESEGENHVE